MKKAIYIFMLAALTACSNDNELLRPYEVRLTSEIASETRGSSLNQQSVQIESGQQVAIFTKGTTNDQNNLPWMVGADGQLVNPHGPIYWVEEMVNVYAYHPHVANVQGLDWNEDTYITFRVSSDQSGKGYLDSDLLWATANSPITTESIKLKFEHKLAKINVKLVSTGFDEQMLSKAKITLLGINVAVDFCPFTGQCRAHEGDLGNILAGVDSSTASAIIVPQTLAADSRFIKIEIGTNIYHYALPGKKSYEGGKSYTYTVQINPPYF